MPPKCNPQMDWLGVVLGGRYKWNTRGKVCVERSQGAKAKLAVSVRSGRRCCCGGCSDPSATVRFQVQEHAGWRPIPVACHCDSVLGITMGEVQYLLSWV